MGEITGNEETIVVFNGRSYKITLDRLRVDISGSDVTKASLGLDKVDNTTDLEKPISTAVQNELESY